MQNIAHAKDLVSATGICWIDARSGPDARVSYAQGHIPGALFADLEKDLADIGPDASKGGRHPLPPAKKFAEWLGSNGIGPDSRVVVYDNKGGANAAARFWWMLRSLGHQKVQVVSGGLPALLAAGFELSNTDEQVQPLEAYPVQEWQLATVAVEDVARMAEDPGYKVIDVREGFRYRGEKEPIDLLAGHIPGAINIPYIENMNEAGEFLSAEALGEKYRNLLGDTPSENIIVHCGSGVTACHTLLALEEAGIHGAALYTGSWSEWSRQDRLIATGPNP